MANTAWPCTHAPTPPSEPLTSRARRHVNNCTRSLPADLVDLLAVSNGLHVVWTARMPGGGLADLGCLHVHGLDDMRILHCPEVSDYAGDGVGDNGSDAAHRAIRREPREGHDEDVIEIDNCGGAGTVGLVLARGGGAAGPSLSGASTRSSAAKDGVGEVWFADRSGTWHFIAATFTEYVKLMAAHLGLPGWQYAFTPAGLSPYSQQWFSVYAPVRLEMIRSATDVSFDALRFTHSAAAVQHRVDDSAHGRLVDAEKILALVAESACVSPVTVPLPNVAFTMNMAMLRTALASLCL
jgi:hypothetical protein